MSLELNSCVLIDYRLWAAKSEGRQWVEHCIEQCIEHPPEPRSGLCPELLADFRIPKPPGCSQGAQRAVFCAVRVADFLAEGAGWEASPGRGGELGCQHRENPRKNQNSPICVQKMDVYADWTLLGTRNLRVWHRNCPQTPSRRPFFEYVRLVV